MKYQLVIQFPESLCGNLDWIAKMEDHLDDILTNAEVDGHDIGSEEVNLFIFTNTPKETFNEVKKILEANSNLLDYTKAAYRDLEEEQYLCLWPKELQYFKIA